MYKNWNDEGLLERGKLFVAISGMIGKTESSLYKLENTFGTTALVENWKLRLNVTILKSGRLAIFILGGYRNWG